MASYDHLPIWKDAVALATLLEEAVRRFPRYHKYALGSDLRRQAYAVCRGVVVANGEREGRARAVERLAVAVEELKLLVQMGKEVVGGASAPISGVSIAAKAAPTDGFVGGASAPTVAPIAAKAAPTGGVYTGGGIAGQASAAMLVSQPDRVPMGIFSDGNGQTGAHGVGDDVAGDILQIFPIAQSMVMETSLPDRHAGCAATPVKGAAAPGFEAPEQIGERGMVELQQPMQMVGHQHEGQGCAQSRFIASAQFPYRQSGQMEIGEQGQTILRHCGDNIAAPDFGDAANAQVATVGMSCHADNHARNTGAVVGGGSPTIRAKQDIAGKPAPTGGGDGFSTGEGSATGDGSVGGGLPPIGDPTKIVRQISAPHSGEIAGEPAPAKMFHVSL